MKPFHKLSILAGLIPLLGASAFGNTVVISDTFNIGGDSTTTGFVVNEGVNQGINPPTTRLTGTAKDNLKYFRTFLTGKPDTSFWIDGNKLRVNVGSLSGRASYTVDGTTAFDFGPSLGVSSATPSNPIVYEYKISMDNNATGTQRMSLGLATTETDANNWDFGLQIYKASTADTAYTVAKRINTNSIGVGSRNDTMFTAGTPASEVSFVIRVTDAGAESGANYHSRVQVSKDNGVTWSYDTATDPVLTSGFRFDGAGRYFSFDIAGGNSSFVTYDTFSVTLLSPTWNGGGADNNWSTGANWSRGIKPTTGEDVVFTGNTRQANVNDISGLSLNSLQLSADGFSLSGNLFTVVSAITNVTGNSTVNNNVTLGGAVSVRTTAGTLTLSGGVDGTGSITKVGNGTLKLDGASSYSGTTTVSAGLLSVNGSLAADSAVSIATAGTLGGSGAVNGTVGVSGTISPGSSPGTFTTGAQTWNTGGKYLWEINTSGSDQIVSSSLDIPATGFTIDVTALEALSGWDNTAAHTWTLVHTTGGISNFASEKFMIVDHFSTVNDLGSAGSFSVTSEGADLVLVFSPMKAVADTATRAPNASVKINVLANDLINSGTKTVSAFDATAANGGTVTDAGGGWLRYTPPVGDPASDTFNYTLSDGVHTAVATVTVTKDGALVQARELQTVTAGAGIFYGIPNTGYTVQYTDSLSPANWQTLTTVGASGLVTTDANGLGTFQDPGPLPEQRYYRIVYP